MLYLCITHNSRHCLIYKEIYFDCKKYGRISIMMQSFFDVTLKFNIPKTVFNPQPKITSSLLLITHKKNINIEYDKLKLIVENAFKHRRKKLSHNLSAHR